MAKILIVDDHPVVRQGLRLMINQELGLQVCGEAENATAALQAAESLNPDMVIIDLSLETAFSGLELIKRIHSAYPHISILTLSMHDENLLAERALKAGAKGYIMKHEGSDNLIEAIHSVLAGDIYLSKKMASKVLRNFASGSGQLHHSRIETLTDRELEVFTLIGEANSTKLIAKQLHLSPKTVGTHRSHLKEKLRLNTAAELVAFAVRWVQTENLS